MSIYCIVLCYESQIGYHINSMPLFLCCCHNVVCFNYYDPYKRLGDHRVIVSLEMIGRERSHGVLRNVRETMES
jgi:hypothetical protein